MRSVRLITHHACAGWPCGRCRLIETALRRALGLTGVPFPEYRRDRPRAAYFSADLIVEVERDCDSQPGPAGGPHADLFVDDQPVLIPDTASLDVLERSFLGHLEEGPRAPAAARET